MNMIITIFGFLCIGFLIGFNIKNVIYFYENKKRVESLNKKFLNILNELESGRSKFKNRFNDNIYITIYLEEYGYVDVLYMLSKNDIALFKEDSCILTSSGVDKKIIKKNIKFHYSQL